MCHTTILKKINDTLVVGNHQASQIEILYLISI